MSDSIDKLANIQTEKDHIDQLNKLSQELIDENPSTAVEYAQQAGQRAQAISYHQGLAESFYNEAMCHTHLKNYNLALENFNKALCLYEKINEPIRQTAILQNLNNIYIELGDYESALTYGLKSLELNQRLEQGIEESILLNNIGITFAYSGNYEKAIKYYIACLDALKREDDVRNEAYVLNNIGDAYMNLSNYEQALKYARKSLDIAQSSNDDHVKGLSLGLMGDIYFYQTNFENALQYYQKSLEVRHQQNEENRDGDLLLSIGKTYFRLNMYSRGFAYLNEALHVAQNFGNDSLICAIYETFAFGYKLTGDWEKAYLYHERFYHLKEVVLNNEMTQKFKKWQVQFKAKHQEKEIKLLCRKEAELTKVDVKLEQVRQQLTETRVKLVQSEAYRINGEKSVVFGKLAEGVIEKINRMLIQIEHDEMRGIINQVQKMVVDLHELGEEDVQLVDMGDIFRKVYGLQKERFENIQVIADYQDDELVVTATKIEISQIFISLLHYLKNGLRECENPTIWVNIFKRGHGVEVEIEDNGCGMSPEVCNQLFEPFADNHISGLSLSTVKKIIIDYKGIIKVKSDLSAGTRFMFWLPSQMEDEQKIF